MLLQFSVTNHRSIKETAIISMKAAADKTMKESKRLIFRYDRINIHPPSGWFFIFGHSPNITSHAQVRLLLACQPRAGLLATRKRVSRIE